MISIYDSDVPAGWESCPLQELTIRKRGYSWAKEDETDRPDETTVPVLRIPNIQKKLDIANLLHLRNVSPTALRESAVTKDWILFVGSNGNPDRVGDSALMTVDRAMVFGSFLMAVASRDTVRLTPEFLANWLRIHMVHEAFSKTSQRTTGLANFSWSAVRRLPVRFPTNADEQKAITNIIHGADDAADALGIKLNAAHHLKYALLQQLFTRGIPGRHRDFQHTRWFRAPNSWTPKTLRQVADVEAGFTMGRDLTGNETVEISYLTVVNVQEGGLDLTDVSTVLVKRSELNSLLLERGDVLMTEGGDRDKLGRGTIWQGQIHPCVYQNHIFRVRFKPDTYKPRLFHHLLQTWHAKSYFFAHAKQTSNLCTINSRELKRLPLFEPSPSEQDEMIALLDAADIQIEAVRSESRALGRLRRSLLENLVTGRVRVAA